MTLPTTLRGQFIFRWIALAAIHLYTKLVMSTFSRSTDSRVVKNLKSGLLDPD